MPSSYVIGSHFEAFIKAQIEAGRYASASEIIRDGLRLLEDEQQFKQMKLDALKVELQKGLDSGPSIAAADVFKEVRAQLAKQATLQKAA